MEVVLKKTKITSNILTQAQLASPEDLGTMSVLGWCIHNKNKTIILYGDKPHRLKRYLWWDDIESEYYPLYTYRGGEISPEDWRISVKKRGYIGWSYKVHTKQEFEDFMAQMKRIKQEAEDLGQIFL